MTEQQIRRAVEMWNRGLTLEAISSGLAVRYVQVLFLASEAFKVVSARPSLGLTGSARLDADKVVSSVLGGGKRSSIDEEKPLTRNQRIIQGLRSGAPRKGKFVVSWESGHGVSGSLDHADEDRARETFARIVLCSVAGTRVLWAEDGAVVARCVVEDL